MTTILLILGAFLSALIFGIGLGVAGMTLPSKILGFLDIFGNWDPSLLFVMVAALGVHVVTYRIILKKSFPVFHSKFEVPTQNNIDFRLIAGAFLFGIGWGLSGFCPGPAIVGSITLNPSVIAFLTSMLVGIGVFQIFEFLTAGQKNTDGQDELDVQGKHDQV